MKLKGRRIYMEHNPYRERDSCSVEHEISRLLWNSEGHYRVEETLRYLSWVRSVHWFFKAKQWLILAWEARPIRTHVVHSALRLRNVTRALVCGCTRRKRTLYKAHWCWELESSVTRLSSGVLRLALPILCVCVCVCVHQKIKSENAAVGIEGIYCK
jgi:hypothetical protein